MSRAQKAIQWADSEADHVPLPRGLVILTLAIAAWLLVILVGLTVWAWLT